MTTTLRLQDMAAFEALQRRMRPRNALDVAVESGEAKKPSKFHAVICEADGIKFRSKKERKRYLELCALRSAGECWFLRQTPFHLPGNTKYSCDFMVFWKDGHVTVEDVKGHQTKEFIRAKKQVEALYPVVIEEG